MSYTQQRQRPPRSVSFQVDQATYEQIEAQAAKEHTSVRQFGRRAVLKAAGIRDEKKGTPPCGS